LSSLLESRGKEGPDTAFDWDAWGEY